jgi:intein/homing endonuclease
MGFYLKTRYGRILLCELVSENISSSAGVPLPEYVSSLFVKEIDEKSAPLRAYSSGAMIKIDSAFNKLALCEIDYFSSQGGRKTFLPKVLDSRLAYFVGYFLGDGGLKDVNRSRKVSNHFDYKIKIGDEFERQIRLIQKLFFELFGLDCPIRFERIEKGERLYYIEVATKPVYRFLTQVFGFPPGSKCANAEVPKLILVAPVELQRWFLRGLFDADGDTRAVERGFVSQSRVKLRMRSPKLIVQVKQMLKECFCVSVNGPYLDSGSSCVQVERQADIVSLSTQNLFFHSVKRWRLGKTAFYLSQKILERSGG